MKFISSCDLGWVGMGGVSSRYIYKLHSTNPHIFLSIYAIGHNL